MSQVAAGLCGVRLTNNRAPAGDASETAHRCKGSVAGCASRSRNGSAGCDFSPRRRPVCHPGRTAPWPYPVRRGGPSPLGVQPHAQLMLKAFHEHFVSGPVIAGGPVVDHGSEPFRPSGPVSLRPGWRLPIRQDCEPIPVCLGDGAGSDVLAPALQPSGQGPLGFAWGCRHGYRPVSCTRATSCWIPSRSWAVGWPGFFPAAAW
jgi:hypothetical protein